MIERILPDKKVKEARITEHPKVLPGATLLTEPEGKRGKKQGYLKLILKIYLQKQI